MANEKSYKTTAIILGIIALVFAVLYFIGGDKASDALEGASDKFTECRESISEWQTKYSIATVTAEARGELNSILEDCNDSVGEAE